MLLGACTIFVCTRFVYNLICFESLNWSKEQKLAQFKVAQNTEWHSLIEVLEVSDLVSIYVQAIHQKL